MKIIRVFPRKTKATPDDNGARFGMPDLFDEADEVHISCTFTDDKAKAEKLATAWKYVAPLKIGGPAYDDNGGEFIPGMYIKKGYVITSRGCPNNCWFCYTWKREGNIRELEIKDGFNVLDSNLLACSEQHIIRVFAMLKRQSEKAQFTGGLEAKRLEAWHCKKLSELKPVCIYLAYDTADDYEPLRQSARLLKEYGLIKSSHIVNCYVLIGYPEDTFEAAEKRLKQVIQLGIMPMAMLYNEKKDILWKRFQREWANKTIVGSKMKKTIGEK
ncbi:MAG: hypothetical protein A2017_06435 [Lentisphaerae bacterium GWF2_44_16]|nr:MAG: hypothetical protein A2017_06435 [Lentisphaerae bacterium GWF2_44_16]